MPRKRDVTPGRQPDPPSRAQASADSVHRRMVSARQRPLILPEDEDARGGLQGRSITYRRGLCRGHGDPEAADGTILVAGTRTEDARTYGWRSPTASQGRSQRVPPAVFV